MLHKSWEYTNINSNFNEKYLTVSAILPSICTTTVILLFMYVIHMPLFGHVCHSIAIDYIKGIEI